jgi:hypothetical protein
MVATFGREIGSISQFRLSLGALVGVAQRLVCDQKLSDNDIYPLHNWLQYNIGISRRWPGDILHTRVRGILADGIVTEAEHAFLIKTLVKFLSGAGEDLPEPAHVSGLAYDDVDPLVFASKSFCLTGDFVFGPRKFCETVITRRGGTVLGSVTEELHYLIIGSLGRPEWKNGSYGLKIEKTMVYKRIGLPLFVVREDWWARYLEMAKH